MPFEFIAKSPQPAMSWITWYLRRFLGFPVRGICQRSLPATVHRSMGLLSLYHYVLGHPQVLTEPFNSPNYTERNTHFISSSTGSEERTDTLMGQSIRISLDGHDIKL